MNYNEYITEINSIAASLVEAAMNETDNDRADAEDLINDVFLHETIDGHQWVIYYHYNDEVIQQSSNDEYYTEIYDNESVGQIISDQGLSGIKTVIAYWAMYADVQEKLEAAFDDFQEELENAA